MALSDTYCDPRCSPDGPPQRDIREMIYRFVRDQYHYMSPSNGYSQNPESLLMYFVQYCQQHGFNFDGVPRYIERIVDKTDPHHKELLRKIVEEMGIPEGSDIVAWLRSVADARDEAQEELARKEQQPQSGEPARKEYTDCLWVFDNEGLYCSTHDKYDESDKGIAHLAYHE